MEFLANTQRQVLLAVGQSELARQVYFTGGTLLAYHYLQHRRSLDLDFFSDNLLDDFFIARTTRAIFEQAGAADVRYIRDDYEKKKWTLSELLQDVEQKFGVQIDLAHLTARLIEAVERLDEVRPLFIGQPPNHSDLRAFFQTNANRYLRQHLR